MEPLSTVGAIEPRLRATVCTVGGIVETITVGTAAIASMHVIPTSFAVACHSPDNVIELGADLPTEMR
jgi:hypothetical protein